MTDGQLTIWRSVLITFGEQEEPENISLPTIILTVKRDVMTGHQYQKGTRKVTSPLSLLTISDPGYLMLYF